MEQVTVYLHDHKGVKDFLSRMREGIYYSLPNQGRAVLLKGEEVILYSPDSMSKTTTIPELADILLERLIGRDTAQRLLKELLTQSRALLVDVRQYTASGSLVLLKGAMIDFESVLDGLDKEIYGVD